MPVNRKWPLHTLMAALQHHFPRQMDKSHPRHVLIEYVMLKDINDTLEDAHRYSYLPLYQHFNTLSFAVVLAHKHQSTCTCGTSNTPQVCAVYHITHTCCVVHSKPTEYLCFMLMHDSVSHTLPVCNLSVMYALPGFSCHENGNHCIWSHLKHTSSAKHNPSSMESITSVYQWGFSDLQRLSVTGAIIGKTLLCQDSDFINMQMPEETNSDA